MKNVTRAIIKRGKKKPQDKRKSPSVSSDLQQQGNHLSVVAGSAVSPARRVSESPTHHILQSSVSPRRDSAPMPVTPSTSAHIPSEAWSKPLNYGSIPTCKVSSIDEAFTVRDREGVIDITKDVQKFLATISELRQAIEEMDSQPVSILDDSSDAVDGEAQEDSDCDEDEEDSDDHDHDHDFKDSDDHDLKDNVFAKLRSLVTVVQDCLTNNPGMQSTSLTTASKSLLKTYEECTHENCRISECPYCNEALENLTDIFTQSVSDYMVGESTQTTSDMVAPQPNATATVPRNTKPQMLGVPQPKGLTSSKSVDNLARFSSLVDLTSHEPIADLIDQELYNVENSIEVADKYIKLRQKYHREIVGYLNKRALLEQRYYTQLNKIVKQSQQNLAELHAHKPENILPLVDVFKQSLEEDARYAMNVNTIYNLQVGHKTLEPLEQKILEYDKLRKDLRANWTRELKKLTEAKSSMKKAKAQYQFYGEELARVKNLLATEPHTPGSKQAEKRKKEVTELEGKWQESEQAYKDAVAHCNDCQYQVHGTAEKSILCAYRRIVIGFDTTLKQGMEDYFTLRKNFVEGLASPLEASLYNTNTYEVGTEFLRFIKQQTHVPEELEDYHFEEFDPEQDNLWDNEPLPSPRTNSLVTSGSPGLLGNDIHGDRTSPTDSAHGRPTLPVLNRNETPSPRMEKKTRPRSVALLDFMEVSPKVNLQRRNSDKAKETVPKGMFSSPQSSGSAVEETIYSRMAKTHAFKKLRTPSRCRGCDTYVYFHGFECEICGLACHRKCLASLAIRCGNKKLPRKMNTFGVDFHTHLKSTKRLVPIIVTKCITEIDERGLDTQGLYRISSAKTKMEKLCQLFEAGSERVDLSELPPHLIGSCLKLYFRQLPEPLLTFDLYHEFITFAKEASSVLPCDWNSASPDKVKKGWDLLERLKGYIRTLSRESQLTLARLMFHLHKVTSQPHVRINCMPASNLGIVFGPNLLRQREMLPSLALLANMTSQAKAVEIMVAHCHDIFNFTEDEIKRIEQLYSEEEEEVIAINERAIDTVQENPVHVVINDEEMKNSVNDNRTPFSTPPERRKQNVDELTEVLEAFGSSMLVGGDKAKTMPQNRIQSSPLLKDSRHWNDGREESPPQQPLLQLPGSVDDGFTASVLNTLEQRLWPQSHAVSVPALEKILTPVMERDDLGAYSDDDDDEESNIISASATNIERRRTHSLTKGGYSEDGDSNDVFHSRTSSNVSNRSRKLYSRSEDNLLCPDDTGVNSTKDTSFEAEIRDLVEDRGESMESLDSQEYQPFQSADVARLFDSPDISPRLFGESHSLPSRSRQMSDGAIGVDPSFTIGSPPLLSPTSLKGYEKTTSLPGSHGSISDNTSDGGNTLDRSYEPDINFQRNNSMKRGIRSRRDLYPLRTKHDTLTDSGLDYPVSISIDEDSQSTEDIPLPDDSAHAIEPIRANHIMYRYSTSRDSGLSDSPDPSLEPGSPASHPVSSNLLTDRLSMMEREGKPSPLTIEHTMKSNEKRHNSEGEIKGMITRHITKVLKVTPSIDLDFPPEPSCPEKGGDGGIPIQRLRMASPEELVSPETELPFDMKRSKSHVGGPFLREKEEQDGRSRIGEFIISEAKITRRASRVLYQTGMPAKEFSKSLETLR